MRKFVMLTMILALIFIMIGCATHSEPDKKEAEQSSSNAAIDITLTEKSLEQSTSIAEKTQSPIEENSTEKVSKEPIKIPTKVENFKLQKDTQSQNETPQRETSRPETTTNIVSETTIAAKEIDEFDIEYWISYAKNYAENIGLTLDETATECWDNPISANANNKNIGADIESRLNRYKNIEGFTSVWIWYKKLTESQYEIYIGYA